MARFHTLSSEDIQRVLQGGRRYRSRSLLMFAKPAQCKDGADDRQALGQVAFIAPKRLGNAVLRNRCKRVLRAGLLMNRETFVSSGICDNYSIIFMATAKTAEQSSLQIAKEIKQFFDSIVSEAVSKCEGD